MKEIAYSEIEKKKAAYALNMCTVSVSQILDYNDVYVLEQEYNSILNNLNLEVIPKDEALLNILQEILNVISFFRVQKIRRDQNEKEYQQRVKNAIWSAIPNLSVVVSGNPVAIGMALATQVGSGYMNYRKEKNSALADKQKAEIELEIAAIEQLHALQRELFTTAWRLADKYGYPDEWRLTEKQIEQYNQILIDPDEYRKYARLEAIQDKFYAYPPFWYFCAHTALYIATTTSDADVKENYLQRAREHFEQFKNINEFNVLREDQLTASACLEYVDLLLLDKNPDFANIVKLISEAESKAGNANDILQLCAIAYLRSGETDKATRLLKILVNENYNAVSNAKILSRLYVSAYVDKNNMSARADYKILESRIDPLYLFPMPLKPESNISELEAEYTKQQKKSLKIAYRLSLNAFSKKHNRDFNAVLEAPFTETANRAGYLDNSAQAAQHRMNEAERALKGKRADEYIFRLSERGFATGYIAVLNRMVSGMEELPCFRNLENHDDLIEKIRIKLNASRRTLVKFQEKLDAGSFTFEDYQQLVEKYSYEYYTENFLWKVTDEITKSIDALSDMESMERYDYDLVKFCNKYDLPAPESYLHIYKKTKQENYIQPQSIFFSYDILGTTDVTNNSIDMRQKMLTAVKEELAEVIMDPDKVAVYFHGDPQFESYLKNESLRIGSEPYYALREKTIAIIDDKTRKDCDLLLDIEGIRLVVKNDVQAAIAYKNVGYRSENNIQELQLRYPDVYSNKNIAIDKLNAIIARLAKQNGEG